MWRLYGRAKSVEERPRGEYGTFSWLLKPALERAGFEISEERHSPAGIYTGYLCVKRDATPGG